MKYELFIALRYLTSRKGHSFISVVSLFSVLGLMVGVATVIVVIGVLKGFEDAIKEKMLGAEPHIIIWAQGADAFPDYERVISEVEEVEGVVAASPAVVSQGLLQNEKGDRRIGVIVKGVDPSRENRVTNIERYLSGPLDFNPEMVEEARERYKGRFTIKGPIILGEGVARKLGVAKGDVVVLFSKLVPDPLRAGGYIPITRAFVVVDIYRSGMYTYDSALAFIPLKIAQEIYELDGMASRVEVRVRDPRRVDEVRMRILSKLGLEFLPRTWMELHGNLFSAMALERKVTFIVEALIVLVAAFNITSMLIMLVMEKVKDIGILKAMGAKNRSIARIFTLQGVIIGICGAALGTGLGLGLCEVLQRWVHIPVPYTDVYPFSTLPVVVDWAVVGLINLAVLIICWLATLYPARQASRLSPAEALRYE